MTRTVRVRELGGPEVLCLEDVTLADPGQGEARVRHTAIGLNYIDVYHRNGTYPVELPAPMGSEAAGVVEAVGPGVTDVKRGDRVAYAASTRGAYADARNIDASQLVPLPDDIDDERAAAMLLKGMTVQYLIQRTFPLHAGQTVLWHAAAGGVGLIACQWLAHLGVKMIGTAGTEEKAELARAHGAAHCIVYTKEDFVARVRELTNGKGIPVVFDSVGRATFMKSLDCLQPLGMYVGFGNASGKPEPFDMGILARKGSLFLTRPTLFTYVATREALLANANALFDVVRSGAVKVEIGKRWPLAEAAAAHRALEARQTTGSTILIP